ncbi:MAG: type II secretion system protein [Sulfuricurvum sp.]
MRKAFTLLELIFVIAIMGILAVYGSGLLFQAYKNYFYTKVNDELSSKSAAAVESIASRLTYRIKPSVIAKRADGSFVGIDAATPDGNFTILEWIGFDADGFRGDGKPYYSGIIDLDPSKSDATKLYSPDTNTAAVDDSIQALGGLGIDGSVLYFVGSPSNVVDGFGWDGTHDALHIIKKDTNESLFFPQSGDFSGVDVYEYYQLAWSAYAVELDSNNTLQLYYNYRPWLDESIADAKKQKIMDNVGAFRFRSAGDLIKIQVCAKSQLVEDYALCKEKTLF